eukprot:4866115-Prymnesium_polylepis.3
MFVLIAALRGAVRRPRAHPPPWARFSPGVARRSRATARVCGLWCGTVRQCGDSGVLLSLAPSVAPDATVLVALRRPSSFLH